MNPVFPTPQDAEKAFYEAFQSANLDAMMAIWANDEDVICIHPNGPRVQGRASIQESWKQIFSSGMELRFEITDVQYFQDALLSIHIVHEYIYVNGDRRRRAPVVTTNIFQLTSQGWKMILHHASPSPDMRSQSEMDRPNILH